MTLPIMYWFDVPSSAALMKSPHAGEDARERERQRHLAERGGAVRVEVGGRLDEPPVDLLQRHVQRQRHERQEVVGDAGDHGRARGQQPPVRAEDADVAQPGDHPAVVGQDQLPGDRPQHVGHEERQDHQQQHQALEAPGLERDEVRQREPDHQAQHGGDAGVEDRAPELRVVGGDRVPVVVHRPLQRVAVLGIAGHQRHAGLVDQRVGEEDQQPEQAGAQEQPGQQPPARRQREPQDAHLRLR
jgi:hypothetical protein